jgi:hypothetical protein
MRCITVFIASSVILVLSGNPALAGHFCQTPLILDLDGDGFVSTRRLASGVSFDIDADGHAERTGWTAPTSREAFLWLDHDRDGVVDDGSELFGSSTGLPDGTDADDGFEALAVYDRDDSGGDGDGMISPLDLVWPHLLLWVDENQDGVSQTDEILNLDQARVVAIELEHRVLERLLGNGNEIHSEGTFYLEVDAFGRRFVRPQVVQDILFQKGAD